MSEIFKRAVATPINVGRKALRMVINPEFRTEAEVIDKANYFANGFDSHKIRQRLEVMGTISRIAISALVDPDSVKQYADVIRRFGTDDLTGLANRLAFVSKLESETLVEGNHAIMMLDLIKFKRINDTKGQHVGDEFLKAFGASLAQNFRTNEQERPQDIVMASRIGGDEFAVLLRDGDALNADMLPQLAYDKAVKTLEDKELMKLMSFYGINEFGVRVGTSMLGEDIATYDEAIRHADHKTHTEWAIIMHRDNAGGFSLSHYIDRKDGKALESVSDNIHMRTDSPAVVFDDTYLIIPISDVKI